MIKRSFLVLSFRDAGAFGVELHFVNEDLRFGFAEFAIEEPHPCGGQDRRDGVCVSGISANVASQHLAGALQARPGVNHAGKDLHAQLFGSFGVGDQAVRLGGGLGVHALEFKPDEPALVGGVELGRDDAGHHP